MLAALSRHPPLVHAAGRAQPTRQSPQNPRLWSILVCQWDHTSSYVPWLALLNYWDPYTNVYLAGWQRTTSVLKL